MPVTTPRNVIIPPPLDLSDFLKMADWVELSTVVAGDGDTSASAVLSMLRRLPQFDRFENAAKDASDAFVLSIFRELEGRQRLLSEAYPFEVEPPLIRNRPYESKHSCYFLCLCLSYFRDDKAYPANANPRLVFEHVSALAAENYLNGEAFIFGTSRKSDDDGRPEPAFLRYLSDLKNFLNEPAQLRKAYTRNKKDDCVDLVVKKAFPDKRPFQLVLFGQCATGKHWRKKLKDLQPQEFWNYWLMPATASAFVRGFFIPHYLESDDDWEESCRHGGIFFDRARLVSWAASHPRWIEMEQFTMNWINDLLKRPVLTPI